MAIAEGGPDVLARAALVRALILARRHDTGALAAHLSAHGSLLLEHTLPTERALVRALRRMARARPKSVYREPSKPRTPRRRRSRAG